MLHLKEFWSLSKHDNYCASCLIMGLSSNKLQSIALMQGPLPCKQKNNYGLIGGLDVIFTSFLYHCSIESL